MMAILIFTVRRLPAGRTSAVAVRALTTTSGNNVTEAATAIANNVIRKTVTRVVPDGGESGAAFPATLVPDLDTAYRVQDEVAQLVHNSGPGTSICGYKIGATNKSAQSRMGLSEPFYGPLYSFNVHRCPAPGSRLPAIRIKGLWNVRGAELEYAFEIGRDVLRRPDGSPWTSAAILGHVWFIYPAIELVSSRLTVGPPAPQDGAAGAAGQLQDIPTPCKVADQALQGATILAPLNYKTPEQWTRFVGDSRGRSGAAASGAASGGAGPIFSDTQACGVELSIDGAVKATGSGSAVMCDTGLGDAGGPAAALAWLANALIARGNHLKEGQVVITGTMTGITPVVAPVPGQRVTISGQFAGFGSVEVQLK